MNEQQEQKIDLVVLNTTWPRLMFDLALIVFYAIALGFFIGVVVS